MPSPPNLPPVYKPNQYSFEAFEASFVNIYPPNKDHSTINLFSIFSKQIPKADINEPVWFYKDPQGETQGPFSSINMDCWNLDKYFPLHLPIAWNQTVQFVTIEYFKNNPFSLIVLAQRYSNNLNRYIPNFSSLMQNRMDNMGNLNTLINKNNNNNFGMNMNNNNFNPLNFYSNLNPMNNMRFNMNPQDNMKFMPPTQNTNNQMNFKNDDPLMQLLGIVGKSNQINMNFNFNRITPPPNPNFNMDQQPINPNFNIPQPQNQPNIQNLNNNPRNSQQNLSNLNNNTPSNPLNVNLPPQTNIQNITSINVINQQQKKEINVTQQPNLIPNVGQQINATINTTNLKMLLGLGNIVNSNNNEKTKQKIDENTNKANKDQDHERKRNVDFPSLNEALGKN